MSDRPLLLREMVVLLRAAGFLTWFNMLNMEFSNG